MQIMLGTQIPREGELTAALACDCALPPLLLDCAIALATALLFVPKQFSMAWLLAAANAKASAWPFACASAAASASGRQRLQRVLNQDHYGSVSTSHSGYSSLCITRWRQRQLLPQAGLWAPAAKRRRPARLLQHQVLRMRQDLCNEGICCLM
jgi:hypothetical protein